MDRMIQIATSLYSVLMIFGVILVGYYMHIVLIKMWSLSPAVIFMTMVTVAFYFIAVFATVYLSYSMNKDGIKKALKFIAIRKHTKLED